MKKVKLLFSKSLNEQTGASTVMRLHANNIDYYVRNDINLSVYTRDDFVGVNPYTSQKINLQGKIKQKLFAILSKNYRKNPILGFFMEYIQNIHPAELFVKNLPEFVNDDILFFNEIYTCYVYLRKKNIINNRIVLVIHNDGNDFHDLCDKINGFNNSFIYKELLKRYNKVLKRVDKIGFVSQFATENFKKTHPEIDVKKVFYVLNGMELVQTQRKEINTYEIVCVGSVNDRKRQETIVRALIRCKSENVDLSQIHFTIVGSGDKLKELKQLSIGYGLDEYVTFVGASSNVEKYLQEANIFILPSSNEGMPMAILEAMRMSLPIVSTRTGEIPNMIDDGKSGILIDPTTDGVYDFILRINDYDWELMGRESYHIFKERYSVEHMLDSYINIFKLL